MNALSPAASGMRLWHRRAAIAAAALLLLALSLAGLAHAWFDGDRLIALAREHARHAWSRELTIGHLSLSLLPTPTLRAERVTLSNPAWAKQQRMAEIESLELRLALKPLLSRRIAPTSLKVRDLRLDLERDADGRANWQLNAGKSSLDWSELRMLRAEDAQLSYRGSSALTLAAPSAELRTEPGWKHVSLKARLERHRAALDVEAQCADLSRTGAADAATDCELAAKTDGARLALAGAFPLSGASRPLAARLDLDAPQPAALLAFFDEEQHRIAAMRLRAQLDGSDNGIRLRDIHAQLGATEADGEISFLHGKSGMHYQAQLKIPRLESAQLLRDTGRALPARPTGDALFRNAPLPWNALQRFAGIDGTTRLRIDEAKLLSGIGVAGLSAELAVQQGDIDIRRFALRLLGGSAEGSLRLDPLERRARLKLETKEVLLERWFSERGRKLPLSGAPMRIEADIAGHGDSMAALAATLKGSIDVHGGRTLIHSARAGEAEKLLTDMLPLFSERDAQQMTLECFAGRMRFIDGRASDSGIAGARSDVSQLLTSGAIDLRHQDVDLRGTVRARHGVPLGISILTSDVRIHGPLKKPAIALDPAGAPTALARLGAAVLTGGLSIIATAAWDAANPATDACAAVFRQRKEK
jgi:hypothetical protein